MVYIVTCPIWYTTDRMYLQVPGVRLVWTETYVSAKTHQSLKIYEEKSVYNILCIDYMLEW